MSNKNDERRINLGYVLDQLDRALTSTGKTAAARATQWRRVLAGVFEGTLRHGSRSPVADTPPWVTLEVAHGGFATGQFKAAGPLQPHEIEQLRLIDRDTAVTERAALNAHFLSDAGRAELRERLRSGHYRVGVPEEAALLVMTWLIDHGEADRAEAILNQIAPFLDQLRFYPVAADSPLSRGEGVYVQSAASVAAALRGKAPKSNIEAMKEAIKVWTPLYDRTVDLFLETVEGESPRLAKDNEGVLRRQSNGSPIVEGGWPCRRFDDGWADRARRILEDYERESSLHRLSGKPKRPKENFARLRGYLDRAANDSETLTGRDVGMIRWIMASYLTKHGSPGSSQRTAIRGRQREEAGRPSHHELARILANRIEGLRSEGGLTDIDGTLTPITAEEATETVAGGSNIPPSLAEKALRCMEAPIENLVARKIVGSSEVVATLLPQLTGEIRAGSIADMELRTLYASVYRSFRQRRSLLLLDLQSQVRLEELPWVAAITPWVGSGRESREAARETLRRASRIVIESFPQTILPNKLVRELRALASAADVNVPLVDELAADIFMGTFSETYLRSAQVAATVLAGTLYDRYYDLPIDRVLALQDVQKTRYGTPESPGFAALCVERSRVESGDRWSVSRNGAIIEQEQILTTHNLAQLFTSLQLADASGLLLGDLAFRCFEWICRRQQIKILEWRTQMQNVKNCAYAWRQMVFYLSMADAEEVPRFLGGARAHLSKQSEDLRQRFEPAMAGLQAASSSRPFDRDGFDAATGGRRFLGWSVQRHWLLPQRLEESTSST